MIAALEDRQRELDRQFRLMETVAVRPNILDPARAETWKYAAEF